MSEVVLSENGCDIQEITEETTERNDPVDETDRSRAEAEDADVADKILQERSVNSADILEEKKKRHRTRKRRPRKKKSMDNDSMNAGESEPNIERTVNAHEMALVMQLDGCDLSDVDPTATSPVFYSEALTETNDMSKSLQNQNKTRNSERKRKPKRKEDKSSQTLIAGTHVIVSNENVPDPSQQMKQIPKETSTVESKRTAGKSGSPKKKSNKETKFDAYLPREYVEREVINGIFLKGNIRINARNYKEAYISSNDGGTDILISGLHKRNRALEGDEVVVQLEPQKEWKALSDGRLQKTGKVVYISEHVHLRLAVGNLKRMSDQNSLFALFSPRDSRIPRMKIPLHECPIVFLTSPEEFGNTLILVQMTEWTNVNYALGKILDIIGTIGDIEAENAAIILENGLDVSPYPEDFKEYFPHDTFHINEDEIKKRTDLRKECIFTIDPKTAKDLDDAMSCKLLDNGNFEVGVHISDVTHYLNGDTPLDDAVSKRATSVYLVDRVHHMLPKELCNLCSLLPGEDKFTYSVIWEMTPNAKVLSHRFARTVINSCSQLAYEHIQEMIEYPAKEWTEDGLPPIKGGFGVKDILLRALWLHQLAQNMRMRRFEEGALRIDQKKVFFSLDESGLPIGYDSEEHNDSHRLIEEFMLLANMTVAEKLLNDHPDIAFLRCHPSPNLLLSKVKNAFEKRGIHLDITSAGSLQKSMCRYSGNDHISEARMMVISALCSRAMCRAKYFCTGAIDNEEEYFHFALNVPLYTHFTSPIRRYADVMVHRLLGASLGYHCKPKWTISFVQRIANNCNRKKYSAKLASEQSTKLYLSLYLKLHGPIEEDAVVLDVKNHSFDVLVCSNGLNQRVYVDKLDADIEYELQDDISVLKIAWRSSGSIRNTAYQVIEIFSLVRVKLENPGEQFKITAELLQPQDNNQNNSHPVDNYLT